MNKFQIALKNFLDPLPDPKNILSSKYWSAPLTRLSGYQIEKIISIVIEEAEISRHFGLFIRLQDLDEEIAFWLFIINLCGGVANMQTMDRQETTNQLATLRNNVFEEISQYYFDLISTSKPKITNSNNAFQCHSEAVQAHILREIYDGNIPLAPSK